MPGFLATVLVSPDDGLGAVTVSNATAGAVIGEIAADLIEIVAANEPRLPSGGNPSPASVRNSSGSPDCGTGGRVRPVAGTVPRDAGADTGLRAWPRIPFPRVRRRNLDRAGRLLPGETLRLVPAADGIAEYLDLGTFVFTREPYGPGSPFAAQPHEDGWQTG